MKIGTEKIEWLSGTQNWSEEISGVRKVVVIFDGSAVGKIKEVINFGKKSDLEMLIIFIGRGKNKLELGTTIKHLLPETKGKVGLKAILFDESQLDFRGDIFVGAEAHGTDTYLKCESLLMSPLAVSKTIPSLEIIANDVKAGHAATAGRVDDESLFYLESRGFDPVAAQRLLLEAFLAEGSNFFSDLKEEDRVELREKLLNLIS